MQEGYGVDTNKPRVEFQLNFDDASSDNAILVFVRGVLQDFSDDDFWIQEFKGNFLSIAFRLIIIQLSNYYTDSDKPRRLLIKNNSPGNKQNNFTVSFQNGVTVQVSSKHRSIHCVVVLPRKYYVSDQL
jgi:hypothetical protein